MSQSFTETVTPIVARHVAHHTQVALEQLGTDGQKILDQIDTARRAGMVDRLVRNLRLPVDDAPPLERELLKATHAEPRGTYLWSLGTATAHMDLRSGLRYLATWLGYSWSELSKLLAVVGNLARWVQSSGGAELQATVDKMAVHCQLSFKRDGLDAKLVTASPLVSALAEVAGKPGARDDGEMVRVSFDLFAH